MEKRKSYNVFAVIRRLLEHMWKQDKLQYGRIALFTVFATVYPFMAVLLPKLAIGILEEGGADAGKRLCIGMLIYFAVAGILAWLTKYLGANVETRNMRIRLLYLADLCKKLMTMDYKYCEDASFFEEYEKGVQAGNSNNYGIEGVYNKLYLLPSKCLTVLGMVVLAGMLSPWLLVSLVVHVLVISWGSKLTHDYEYSMKKDFAKAGRRGVYYKKTSQDFSYGKDIRIFNLRERIMNNYQQEIDAYVKLFEKVKNKEYVLGFLPIITLLLTNVLTYGSLIGQVLQGMPISSFTMYVTMITSLMALMIELGTDFAYIWNEGEYVDDFYRLMDTSLIEEGEKTREDVLMCHLGAEQESTKQMEAGECENKSLEIVFDHVSFRYPKTEKNVFTDLNLTIHAGERLAIVGVNGAGKSTLVKLMTGLFYPTEGHIYINGVDIRKLKKSELYGLYSAVFQDVNVLAFSLRENVTCRGDEDLTEVETHIPEAVNYVEITEGEEKSWKAARDSKVQTALDKVGLWEKVEGFEAGLDQMMLKVIDENGTDFSGGERQKLSIARGLYKNGAMVIMDEPTAALDALAEAEIYENFSSLVEGKTALYVSHRLASTRFCDKIALFDGDGLSEYGTHEELMEKKGKYYEMFVIQGKYYQKEAAV